MRRLEAVDLDDDGGAQRLLAQNATDQALNIIESRINALGITEPTLQTHGAQNLASDPIADAGVQDPEREDCYCVDSPS
jgi:preprotein translocase subunit SecD